MSQHRVKQEIAVVGIDLGKTWIQVCGQDGRGQIQLERRMKPKALRTWLCTLAVHPGAVSDRHGSLWPIASLGPDPAGLRTRGQADRTAVREAVREGEQDRPCGCPGDLRGGAAPVDAVCGDQDGGSAGPAGPAQGSPPGRLTAHGPGEPDPRAAGGVRHRDRPGTSSRAQAVAGHPGGWREWPKPGVSARPAGVV